MNVSILYPWADALVRRTGASLRVGSLIDYLRETSDRLTVVSTGTGSDRWQDGVEYRFVAPPAPDPIRRRPRLDRGLAWGVLRRSLGARKGSPRRTTIVPQPLDVEVLNFFVAPRFDSRFQTVVAGVIERSDVVFVEYPFWGRVVIPLCRMRRIPTVVTSYDVLSRTFGANPAVRRSLEREEVWTLRNADHAFCVSEEDRRFFAAHGVDARCAPNPIDVESCYHEPRGDAIDAFRRRRGLSEGPLCVFFGSNHPPNCEAAAIVEHLLAPQVRDSTFVIAGTCAPPGRTENVARLGEVDDDERRILYTLASVVLIPLQHGTGSSLKLMEALAHGKAVVSTSVGARGYPVQSGIHALVADHLPAHPHLIRALLRNPERRLELGMRGRALAELYDYRRVFAAYDEAVASC